MSDENRYVITNHRTYQLDPDQQGEPAEKVLGTEKAARFGLTGAKVYTMPDGRRVIAKPDPDAS